jgi:hypothetical protein
VHIVGENFDLREKIEVLNENMKRLKRQLKLYMKKLAESGGQLMYVFVRQMKSLNRSKKHEEAGREWR